jgi:hypothetical protein
MNDHFDDLVRRALAREADKVQPNPYGLERIRSRLQAPARRRPWLLPTAAAVLGTAAAVGAFAVLTNGSEPTSEGPAIAENTGTTGPAPTTVPTTAPQSSAPESTGVQTSGTPRTRSKPTTVPVYWLGDTVGNPAAGVRLYRTFLGVTGDPVLGAVRAMTEGQSGDPDYSSGWTGAQVASVDVSSTAIAVDFSQPPTKKGLGSQAAQVAAQELVYTVQGAVSITGGAHASAPVVVTVNGKPADLWGSVDTSKPIARASASDVQAFIWITSPAEGATVLSPVQVSGVANTFEATVNWRVRDAATNAVVRENHTQATAGTGTFGTFKFSVTLPAGRYVVECLEFSAQDGHETNTDTKSVTVR